jgi:pimeloyl-ACP methyl ester carboxylesterase
MPRSWLERRFIDLRRLTYPDSGGHFASMEQPETFVDELRTFFRMVR